MLKNRTTDDLFELLGAGELAPDVERKLLQSLSPDAMPHALELLAVQRRRAQRETVKAQRAAAQAEEKLSALAAPPLSPGTVLSVLPSGDLDVHVAGRRLILKRGPDVSLDGLKLGDEVLVNAEATTVVAHGEPVAGIGAVMTVAELSETGAVVRGGADDELVALCDAALLAELEPGDRVVLHPSVPLVVARLPKRTQSEFVLDQPPAVSFADIGGHDDVTERICRDLDLHLRHEAIAHQFRLRPLRGILLAGAPGLGKTLIASAIARYLAETRNTRFLSVPPGALRKMYYGQTEKAIRELFAAARAFDGQVVIFFDELDSFGARGVGIGQDIDGRVLGTLLAEIDGLGATRNIVFVAATNRVDLCDAALVRPGRLGDYVYRLGRPSRAAARQIFSKYLTSELPYAGFDDRGVAAAQLAEGVLAYLYARNGGALALARATLADGTEFEIGPPELVSGALIASAVERAKHAAAHRALDGGGGLELDDLLASLDEALAEEARRLSSLDHARQTLDHPRANEIARVRLADSPSLRPHRYVRAA